MVLRWTSLAAIGRGNVRAAGMILAEEVQVVEKAKMGAAAVNSRSADMMV